jgi:hypothetical protein
MEISMGQLELALLRATLDVFELQFYRRLGPLYIELDESRAHAAKLRARFMPSAHRESIVSRERARVSAADCARALTRPPADPERVKRLHRDLARSLHPDLALDPVRRGLCEKLMAQVNVAYQEADMTRLEGIQRAVSGDTDAAQEMTALSHSPVAQLRTRVEYAARHNHDQLNELAQHLRALTTEVQQRSGFAPEHSNRESGLMQRALADLGSVGVRRLNFPSMKSMGEISVRKELDIDSPVTVVGSACRVVSVPFGKSVLLRLGKECTSLEPLCELDPDDLNGLIDEWPDFVNLNNETVQPLARFRRLEELHLARTEINGHAFDNFPPMHELRVLILDETEFDDHGMVRLAESAWMQRLDLSFTKVTGRGLGSLHRMASLRDLSLYGTDVNDDDLAVLDSLPALRNLNLGLTNITDAAAVRLSRRKTIEVLHLGGTAITDGLLETLAGLPALRDLVLWETKITKAVVEVLRTFPSLRYLDTDNTAVTKEAMESFRAVRPEVKLPGDIWADSASA